jgi:hypothetical protein
MDPAAARQVVADALADIAPEIDLAEVDEVAPFAAECDLDSMDLLSLAEAIHERTGLDIGGGDLPPRWTLVDLTGAIAERA